jgi:uncharacterized protein (UPF0335 family)
MDTTTTIRVGGGPEIPIDLDNPDAPENAATKEAIAESLRPTVAADRLRLLIERVENLEAEKKAIAEDISDVLKEAKDSGFDTKTIKRIIRLRKMETHERQEAEALLSTYMNALGMTPIEEAIALAAAA